MSVGRAPGWSVKDLAKPAEPCEEPPVRLGRCVYCSCYTEYQVRLRGRTIHACTKPACLADYRTDLLG